MLLDIDFPTPKMSPEKTMETRSKNLSYASNNRNYNKISSFDYGSSSKQYLNPSTSFKNKVKNEISQNIYQEKLNYQYQAETEELFARIGLESEAKIFLANTRKWLLKKVLSNYLRESLENLGNLNKELNEHFGKHLIDFDHFNYETNQYRNLNVQSQRNRLQKITLDELFAYYEVNKVYGTFWEIKNVSMEESRKIHQNFLNLMRLREKFDKILKVPDYEICIIRLQL